MIGDMAPQRPQPKLAPAKIDRSAFLYLPPDGRGDDNAKCKACILYLAGNRCIIHAPDVVTRGEDSCCFYIPGRPAIRGRPVGLVTPEESGLVKRQVRCENCFYE